MLGLKTDCAPVKDVIRGRFGREIGCDRLSLLGGLKAALTVIAEKN
jgi:hypothetical protein